MAIRWWPKISPRACAGWWIRPRPRSTRRSSTSSSMRPTSSPARSRWTRSASRRPTRTTVVITLDSPAPYLPGLMAHPSTAPLHRPSLAKLGERFARPGDQVSNGAFVLKEWLQGSYIRVERNPHYWGNAANKIDGVKFLQIADENAELRAYRAGELHCTVRACRAGSSTGSRKTWPRSCTSRRSSAPTTTASISIARCSRNIRSCARRCRWRSTANGWRTPCCAWASCRPTAGCRPACTTTRAQTFDYAQMPMRRAHRSRAQAAGRSGIHAREAAALRAALQHRRSAHQGGRGGGVDVEGSARRRGAARGRGVQIAVRRTSTAATSTCIRLSWVGDYNDPYTFLQYLKSGFGINLPHYASAAYDALLEEASRQTDAAKRRALLEQAERTDARGPSADSAVFLREQAPGEARGSRAGTTTS